MNQSEKTARRLFDNWNSKTPYESLSGEFAVGSVDGAYAVQSLLQKLHIPNRGELAGRKIALSSKAMQQMIGYGEPTSGAIFLGDVALSPARVEARDFVRLGLEFELALELNADVAPQGQAHTSQSAYGYVAAVRPAFELIEDRGADYAHLDPLTLIADNCWCGGVVLGPALDNWRELDLSDIPSMVYQVGAPDEKANTGAADPLGSLAWVLNHFSDRGITIAKGEHVITGSVVRTRFPVAGDSFTYEVAGSSVQVEVL